MTIWGKHISTARRVIHLLLWIGAFFCCNYTFMLILLDSLWRYDGLEPTQWQEEEKDNRFSKGNFIFLKANSMEHLF